MASDKTSQSAEVMTLTGLAVVLGLSWKTVWRLVKKGEIKAYKVGGQWRVTEQEYLRLTGKNTSSKSEAAAVEAAA